MKSVVDNDRIAELRLAVINYDRHSLVEERGINAERIRGALEAALGKELIIKNGQVIDNGGDSRLGAMKTIRTYAVDILRDCGVEI